MNENEHDEQDSPGGAIEGCLYLILFPLVVLGRLLDTIFKTADD